MRKIAIAVRDTDLFLLAEVVRDVASDVYVNWPRNHVVGWKPHTSYHASGQHHQKSFGKAHLVQKKQKPDATFKGTVNLVSFGVAQGEHRAVNARCDPKDFSAVFEIPLELVGTKTHNRFAYVDLVEPGVEPVLFPGGTVLRQETYKDSKPWIVISYLEI